MEDIREVLTVGSDAFDECLGCGATLTLLFNVSSDFGDVPQCRGPVYQAWHSGAL